MVSQQRGRSALFRLGFRPFFLAAGLFAVISMLIWMAAFVFQVRLLPFSVTPIDWHAHEMIYGYALAVIAGFLLTAVRNWTGIQTLQDGRLLFLLLLWLLARMAAVMPGQTALLLAVICDQLFILALSYAITLPVVKTRQWKQMGLISKVYFFFIGNLIYALGLFGVVQDGQRIGLMIGLYMILSLILVLSRRLLPMFVERGVGYDVTLRSWWMVDLCCFLLFLIFAITDIFFDLPAFVAVLAALLVLLHTMRLSGWYTHGIWRKPLLWVLFLAYGWIIIGFALKCAVFLFGISPSLAVHAFTAGGIGMMTLGMMARVALGHTGRDINQPPKQLAPIFTLICVSVVVRVASPVLDGQAYLHGIAMSQALWVAAFMLFLMQYVPVLMRPRIDGRDG